MQRKLWIAVTALAVAAIGSSGTRALASHEPEAADIEQYVLIALVSGTDANAPVGFVPSSPKAPKMRPIGGDTTREWAAPQSNPLDRAAAPGGTAWGIPELVLAAYRNAELALGSSMPGCGLSWNLLAGIGKVESDHAGAGSTDVAGTTLTPILGPALDGTLPGNEVISTSGGYARAVGPMQFLPSTWQHWGTDGNGDGVADPNNVFDAALSAGKYLCADGADLRNSADEVSAVLRYNHSTSYAATVLSWAAAYRNGGVPVVVDVSAERVQPSVLDVSTTTSSAEGDPEPVSRTTVSEPTTIVAPAVRPPLPTVAAAADEPVRQQVRQTTVPYVSDPVVQTYVPSTRAPEVSAAATPTPATPVTVVPSVVVPSLAAPPLPTAVQPGVPQPVLPVTIEPQAATPTPATPDPAAPQTISPQTLAPQTVSPEPVTPQTVDSAPVITQPVAPQVVVPSVQVPNLGGT